LNLSTLEHLFERTNAASAYGIYSISIYISIFFWPTCACNKTGKQNISLSFTGQTCHQQGGGVDDEARFFFFLQNLSIVAVKKIGTETLKSVRSNINITEGGRHLFSGVSSFDNTASVEIKRGK
jgi:hypothetical protein